MLSFFTFCCRWPCCEFGGIAKSLLVAPGHRKIAISLPGCETFSTEVDLSPNQKFEIKTDLVKANTPQANPLPNQK